MDASSSNRETGTAAAKNRTTVERTSDREIVITRTFNAPARLVFEAWSKAELLQRWWVPKSVGITLLKCEADVRTGGTYRFTFAGMNGGSDMVFFGRYLEVVPSSKIVWTNEESGEAGAVTTVTFEEKEGTTLLTMRETYPSKEALEAGMGAYDAMGETMDQLHELLETLGAPS